MVGIHYLPFFVFHLEESILSSSHNLSDFLISIERRAFKQALFAVRDEDTALDIVQDSMLKLAEKYNDRPAEELPLLFQRILQNTIRDFYRRSKVRSTWVTLFSSLFPSSLTENDDQDPLETLPGSDNAASDMDPARLYERSRLIKLLESEISRLPTRQREAFLLRYWEELDVAETAEVMGCTEGSVKTHCSRACHALAAVLKNKGIKP